jgi:putative membrane protein (TIGR04086 family)
MNYIKAFLHVMGIVLVLVFVLSLFNYFGIISSSVMSVLLLITSLLSIFYGGFYVGKRSNKKGFIEGIKFGLLLFIILFIVSLFINNDLKFFNRFIYFLIVISSSMLGGMFGINKGKKES